jgi:cation-transporting ATPase 13A1
MLALLVLLAFALVAAGYVLKTGLEKGEKTPHELLLKCIIILTAVVPRQLPMQMAVAVNTALMALLRAGVYCTEPFRVPLAGKLTHCLFDKTGTLTTDELLPVGIVNGDATPAAERDFPDQVAVRQASARAALVLAACHSLVAVDEKLAGDPIEMAALQGVGWTYDAEVETATPILPAEAEEGGAGGGTEALAGAESSGSGAATVAAIAGGAAGSGEPPRDSPVASVRILARFHFASQLQRMAVVAEVALRPGGQGLAEGAGRYCLVKGSPEALRPLLAEGAAPAWFERAHTSLAERGLRVLALAYRRLSDEEASRVKGGGTAAAASADRSAAPAGLTREEVERGLSFAGFIAFECLSRADSALVIGALQESGHQVAMLTGDSPLTALHVARTCAIVDDQRAGILLTATPRGPAAAEGADAGASKIEWVVATGERRGEKRPLALEEVDAVASEFNLMATGDALDATVAAVPEFWGCVDKIHVFARMTPQGKAEVVRELQRQGFNVLMCGDGGNDVGALKQADVGLALLAGYGNVNTTGGPSAGEDKPTGQAAEGQQALALSQPKAKASEQALNEHQKQLAKRTKEAGKARQKFLWDKQKELNQKHKEWLEEEMEARARRGEGGFMAQAGAVKVVLSKYTAELKREMKEYDMSHGNIYDADASEKDMETARKDAEKKMKDALENAGSSSGLPMVRPGDASVAAPFTSKAPSVTNCVDLIRQGRCTLLSALQQQQIMMLNCIINAYVLSALSLEGSRSSERQMLASQWLLTTASLAFSYSSACDRMHPVRPLRSLFHPAVFVSMFGQACIHLVCMVTVVRMARAAMEEGSAERQEGWTGPSIKDVGEFWRIERLKRRGLVEKEETEELDWAATFLQMWTQPFLPNLMNTVVFLVETAQTVAILFVNYKGQPWMKGVTENRALFLSVFVVAAAVAAAAWEFSPELNGLIHLSPFPDDRFRWAIMGLVGLTLVGTFVWDRLCVAIFAKDIFRAMIDSAKETTFQKDILPIFITAGKVLMVFVILGTGNLILAGVAFFYWRHVRKDAE